MIRRVLLAVVFLVCFVSVVLAYCIALTYDDGPVPDTARLLDVLKREDAHATFCVVGKNARLYPDLIRRMVAEGHQLCNHSWDHPYVVGVLSDEQLKYQFGKTEELLKEIADVVPSVIRTPGGGVRERVGKLMERQVIYWDIDPKDFWRRDAGYVTSYVLARASAGKIVLLHDIWPSTVTASRSIVRGLKAKGLAPVTLRELSGARCSGLRAEAG